MRFNRAAVALLASLSLVCCVCLLNFRRLQHLRSLDFAFRICLCQVELPLQTLFPGLVHTISQQAMWDDDARPLTWASASRAVALRRAVSPFLGLRFAPTLVDTVTLLTVLVDGLIGSGSRMHPIGLLAYGCRFRPARWPLDSGLAVAASLSFWAVLLGFAFCCSALRASYRSSMSFNWEQPGSQHTCRHAVSQADSCRHAVVLLTFRSLSL